MNDESNDSKITSRAGELDGEKKEGWRVIIGELRSDILCERCGIRKLFSLRSCT